jgi:ketosteroid isomerase-like protein
MTQRSSLDTVRELYGAFGRGNLPAVLDLMDPNIAWEYPGPKAVPWAGSFVVLGFQRVRSKRTGRSYEAHWATAWTVSGGKITTFREYTDTAAETAALADTGAH